MSSMAFEHSIGKYITSLSGGAGSAVAAGAGDATEVNGPWVSRANLQSCIVVVTWKTTLTATKTLSFAGNLQEATDSSGTGAADFGTAFTATVVATGPGGGGTVEGTTEVLLTDLAGAGPYMRAQITPDMSATSADVATWSAAIILPKETIG